QRARVETSPMTNWPGNQLCCARLEAYGAAVRSTAISAHGTPQNPAATTGAIRRDRPGHPVNSPSTQGEKGEGLGPDIRIARGAEGGQAREVAVPGPPGRPRAAGAPAVLAARP